MEKNENNKYWAVILGASSGFGGASAIKLAEDGYNIIGIHLDRQATLPNVERIKNQIKSFSVNEKFYNVNAADAGKRAEIISDIKSFSNGEPVIKVLIHSLAFGTLRPFVPMEGQQCLTKAQMEMTLDVMAHSLVYWVQDLLINKLFAKKARIFAMTSSGGHTAIPFYGAVSAAKAALESHIRQLASELGNMEIAVNAIMAGVTNTPAAKKIPGFAKLIEIARRKNPRARSTTPKDVAKVISLLCKDGGEWISGSIVHADGGEDCVQFVGQGESHINL